jgi:hypothetical protein
MCRKIMTVTFGLFLSVLVLASAPAFAETGSQFEVTITNLTRGQFFTPTLVASHRRGVSLFTLGSAPSAALEAVAEEGSTDPLKNILLGNPAVKDVQSSGVLLGPGESVSVTVQTSFGFNHISLIGMLIPTNDGFLALNGVQGPRKGPVTYHSPAYDAGSERNDELCASIPGPPYPECGGPGGGGAPAGGEEGYVHIHAGIHGIGDFNAAERDWRNPVAKIDVRRVF